MRYLLQARPVLVRVGVGVLVGGTGVLVRVKVLVGEMAVLVRVEVLVGVRVLVGVHMNVAVEVAVYVKSQHRHRRAIGVALAPVACLRRAFQRACIGRGSSCTKTPLSRSSALLVCVTFCDQRLCSHISPPPGRCGCHA